MKIYCPYCQAALDYHGGLLAICRCANCGKRFLFHNDTEYMMPYEEETALFVEEPKSREQIAYEQKKQIQAEHEKYVARQSYGASSTVNWTPDRKAEARRDMEITGNYFKIS